MRGRASKIKRIHQCKQDGRNRRHALEVEEEAHAPLTKEAPQDAPALQVGRNRERRQVAQLAACRRTVSLTDWLILRSTERAARVAHVQRSVRQFA